MKDDGEPCDDGNPCTEVDTCYGGACYSGAAVTCPDSRGCNGDPSCATCGIDTRDPTTGQCHLELQPEYHPCDRDGDRCGTSDARDGAGHRAAGPAVVVATSSGRTCPAPARAARTPASANINMTNPRTASCAAASRRA
ncbi:MAG: hypothetical protein U1F43_16170 [Myxococcota bacterium]